MKKTLTLLAIGVGALALAALAVSPAESIPPTPAIVSAVMHVLG
ncbi:hypothetical protein [Alicyclobacillus sp. SO9]|nr:hypothetical protein [Alicyclobacillus sp. SO9]